MRSVGGDAIGNKNFWQGLPVVRSSFGRVVVGKEVPQNGGRGREYELQRVAGFCWLTAGTPAVEKLARSLSYHVWTEMPSSDVCDKFANGEL